jgi:hypothetical protein
MRLYHGSNMKLSYIDLGKCRPYKDFGQGFYCTALSEQAESLLLGTFTIFFKPNF